MSTNDGGPFSPCEVEHIEGEVYGIQTGISRSIHTGASLRDHFAGLAMQGIIATIAGSGVVIQRDGEPDEQLSVPRHGDLIAQFSYQMADAMLAAREQRT